MTYFLYDCYFIQLLFYTCYFIQFLLDIYTIFLFLQWEVLTVSSPVWATWLCVYYWRVTDHGHRIIIDLPVMYLPILPQVFKIWKFQWQVNVSVSALVDFALIINKHLSIEIRYLHWYIIQYINNFRTGPHVSTFPCGLPYPISDRILTGVIYHSVMSV